ncbi:hypothetical protein BJ085DRAFT_29159 [Dimargaris cristalligena]|uniref:Nucleoporin POM152 N-terminal transmembrane domain-containing protein n=1 Tax=Dimargaris cristalligena TaxID=215637 RepID=A0A4P9ZRB1_9FUNG|nr:hypothetical protein BJ085DRAFT_29159 [Dimargaris cristalligena]|eukprot:RKP35698.1 hypothetical protein BJ085DRAFT_29159 [Dimargaris cristalligena]
MATPTTPLRPRAPSPLLPPTTPVPAVKFANLPSAGTVPPKRFAASAHHPPVISTALVAGPEQRLYALGAVGLVQAYKLCVAFSEFLSLGTSHFRPLFYLWVFTDLALIATVWRLRIPWLQFPDHWYLALAGVLVYLDARWFL